MCLHEDTLKDSSGKESGESYQADFATSASALGGSDAGAEEIALDDTLEKELAQEVEFWRLENAGPADTTGSVFGISASRAGRGDAEVFRPEPAAAARWAGIGTSEPPPSSASWPRAFQAEPFDGPPGDAATPALRPPPARRPPDSTAGGGGDRGAWTEAAAANLDSRGARGANRGAGATAVRGEAPRMPVPLPPHPALESGCEEANSSSDEDGFAGFLEHGADSPSASASKKAPTELSSDGGIRPGRQLGLLG